MQRGSITFWLTDDFEKIWHFAGKKQRGHQFEYSEPAMIILQTVKNVFHLPNRATEGFVRSIFAMLKICLTVPDHTTLSRRARTLKVSLLPVHAAPWTAQCRLVQVKQASGHMDIVTPAPTAGAVWTAPVLPVPGTGKIFGEGEWKVRTHGKSKRRTWRKLHVGMDPQSSEIRQNVAAK